MASGSFEWRDIPRIVAVVLTPLVVMSLLAAAVAAPAVVATSCAPQRPEPGTTQDQTLRGMATYESVVVIHLNGNTYYVYEGSSKCCLLDVERGTGAPKD